MVNKGGMGGGKGGMNKGGKGGKQIEEECLEEEYSTEEEECDEFNNGKVMLAKVAKVARVVKAAKVAKEVKVPFGKQSVTKMNLCCHRYR